MADCATIEDARYDLAESVNIVGTMLSAYAYVFAPTDASPCFLS